MGYKRDTSTFSLPIPFDKKIKQGWQDYLPWVWHWAKGFEEAGPLPGTQAPDKLDQIWGVGVGDTLVDVNTNFVYYVDKHLARESYIISSRKRGFLGCYLR